jgi:hypothetical protein
LPEGTAIDLRASGVGVGEYFYVPGIRDNDENIIIMFTPEGRVARVSFSTLPTDQVEGNVEVFDQTVVDNLFLLVGRRENIAPPDVSNDPTLQTSFPTLPEEERAKQTAKVNWLGGSSRWIVIGSQSGRIVTVENAFGDLPTIATSSGTNEDKRNQQITAAREFTREMTQLRGR